MWSSISQRATGVALYAGTALLALWLVAAAIGGDFFGGVDWLVGSWFGLLVLFGFTWALLHHMFGGIRHFIWDRIIAMDPAGREMIVRVQLAASIGFTLLLWAIFVWFK